MNQSGMNLAGKWSFEVGAPQPMTPRERLNAAIKALRIKHSQSMPTSSMQPTAVANALKGEKSFDTVQFPVTGDMEIDAISGIRAVLNQIRLHPSEQVRVLEYSLNRAHEYLEHARRALESQREAALKQYSQQKAAPIGGLHSSGLVTASQAMGAMPYPSHSSGSSAMDDLEKALGLGKAP